MPLDPVDWTALREPSTLDNYLEFLTATELTTVDEALRRTAADLVGSLPPHEAATAIADWVRAQVEYVPGSTGVRTSAQEAWSLRKGVCQDIAHLTLGMLRSVGIPARYVSGYLYPRSDGASATPWRASRTRGSSGGAATGTASIPRTGPPRGSGT